MIGGSLLGELERSGRISLFAFYGRRVRRLLPALALMLLFVALAAPLLGPAASQRSGSLTGIFAALFAANMYLYSLPTGYFDVSTTLNPLLHTWTLAVEEQFYLVFPLLLLLGWRLGRRRFATLLFALCAFSYAWSRHLSPGSSTTDVLGSARLAFYSAPARAWEFGAGAVLALLVPWLARTPAAAARIAGWPAWG